MIATSNHYALIPKKLVRRCKCEQSFVGTVYTWPNQVISRPHITLDVRIRALRLLSGSYDYKSAREIDRLRQPISNLSTHVWRHRKCPTTKVLDIE
jgi:hypothetical protein